tara:strand:- start:1079 stop:1246 length:168 start_codon:yes stop_codon:yes gene_type:complete
MDSTFLMLMVKIILEQFNDMLRFVLLLLGCRNIRYLYYVDSYSHYKIYKVREGKV